MIQRIHTCKCRVSVALPLLLRRLPEPYIILILFLLTRILPKLQDGERVNLVDPILRRLTHKSGLIECWC